MLIRQVTGLDVALRFRQNRRLSSKDPQQGLSFAQALPEGAARSDAYKNTFREWADSNPTDASTQLNSLPKGADRDAAISGLARSVVRDDAPAAITWAESITDPATRQQSLTEVLQRNYRKDPDSVNNYMASNNWTQEQQNAVKIEPDNGGRRGGFGGGPPGGFGGGFGRGGR